MESRYIQETDDLLLSNPGMKAMRPPSTGQPEQNCPLPAGRAQCLEQGGGQGWG